MENISNKLSYVQGLMDGLKFDEKSNKITQPLYFLIFYWENWIIIAIFVLDCRIGSLYIGGI